MSLGILARLERFAASSTGTVFERSHAAAWASQILSVSRFTQIQHANIADIPSRGDPDDPALAGDYAILRELGATRVTAKLPPIPPSFYATADTP